jgi:PadR family transcriptional regulator AphA
MIAGMQEVPPTTYALLGMLAARSWTGYELTQQLRRSLRFVWPSSEGHLYREQKRLIRLGWATLTREPVGKRDRNRYAITPAGKTALRDWLRTEPGEPHFEIEGIVRLFYGDQAEVDDMLRSIDATRRKARQMLDALLGFVDEYLEAGGPLTLLEEGRRGGDGAPEFHGRPLFPERLHVVALVLEATTALLAELEVALGALAAEVRTWPSPTDAAVTPLTRARLERIRHRFARLADA